MPRGLTTAVVVALTLSVAGAIAGAVGLAPTWVTVVTCLMWPAVCTAVGAVYTFRTWFRTHHLMALGQVATIVGYGISSASLALGNGWGGWFGFSVVALGAPVFAAGLMIARGDTIWRRTLVRRIADVATLSLGLQVILWRLCCLDGNGHLRVGASVGAAVVMAGTCLTPCALVVTDRRYLADSIRGALGPLIFAIVPGLLISGHSVGPVANPDLVRLCCLAAATVTTLVVVLPRPTHVATDRPEVDSEVLQRSLGTAIAVLVGAVMIGAQARLGFLKSSLVVLLYLFVAVVLVREVLSGLERERLVNKLNGLAHHDPLTGLGNRRELMAHLRRLYHHNHPGTVMVVDVDRFKEINHECGHAAGDALLVQFSEVLTGLCTGARVRGLEDPMAYRLGGDEFVVVVPGGAERASCLADPVREQVVAASRRVDALNRITVTASLGLAPLLANDTHTSMTPDEALDPDAGPLSHALPSDVGQADPLVALTRASRALRIAKETRNTLCWFTEEIEARSRRELLVERRLRAALDDPAASGLSMHFQPVVEMESGRIRGLEALARWTDPGMGPVSPVEFVPLAEETGQIHRLGRFAIQEAVKVIRACVDIGADIYVTVNVSPVQLRRSGFSEEVRSCCDREEIPRHLLTIEVTEGIFMDPHDIGVRTIHELVEAGFRIAIDDFGFCYSSLGYMSRLPAHVLKLDRSLTCRIAEQRTYAVVRAITQLSSDLGVDVVMEGVEDRDTADILKALGARLGQGWLWSPAVSRGNLAKTFEALGVHREADLPVRG